MYSQNFSWGASLVNLPGRAGLDAGLGISYNSLVWTKYVDASNNNQPMMVFDADSSNVSPGFRFGFPVIEPAYYDNQTQKFAYLMVMPSGERVEFRQTASLDTYETADSSYSQLKINGSGSPNDPIENITITVFYMGGTQMTYQWKAGAYRCSRIQDRNGNYIDITHNDQGLLTKIKDTLEREINVNYDTQLYPTTITQTWKDNNGLGSNVTHTWATFNYEQIYINPNFDSTFAVYGPDGDAPIKALKSILYPNGNSTWFYYNDYGQVWKIRNIAADSLSHALNAVRTDLETPSTGQQDCPRFTKTYNKIENFNGGNEFLAAENTAPASANFTPPGGTQQNGTLIEIKRPDGAGNADKLRTKIYSASSGWAEGLPVLIEDWADEGSGLVKKRWTWTKWAQDDMTVTDGQPFPYILNPRVEETKVGDATNTRRTTIEYYTNGQTTVSDYGVVKEIIVYDTDQTTVLKKIVPEYLGGNEYLSRRVIGLLSKRILYAPDETGALTFASVQEFGYDEENFAQETNQNISTVVQHDNTNYSSSFVVGRGNLTSIKRLDVTGATSAVTTKIRYDIAGSVVARLDPLNRKVRIEYADSFNDDPNNNLNRNTFAYPTKIYDPDENYSEVKYRFDIGANVWAKSPAPAGNTSGKETTRVFDDKGRLQKESILKGGTEYAYTRYEYPTNGIQSKIYSTLIDTNTNGVGDSADEVLSEAWTDGAGRVRYSRTEHPGSTGGWSGSKIEYDILGRVMRSTVPTEINPVNTNDPSTWIPAGDDYRGLDGNNQPIWLWNSLEYDWQGRVTREINTDGTDKLYSYNNCGCAGGLVTTIKGEVTTAVDVSGNTQTTKRRTQKIYEDILGRTVKTELWDLDGGGSAPYSTVVQKFNGRDQVFKTIQYAGAENPNNTHQETTASYDGHGRLKQSHRPEQRDANNNPAYTSYNYNADDSISSVVDARGAETEYTYNDPRGLLTLIEYQPPSGVTDTPDVYFYYDALGNLTQMNDGPGVVDYSYNELSQLTSETRKFDDSLSNAPLVNGNQAFKLEYSYTLGGQLKSLKDPYGQQINYAYDKVGRLSSVTDPNSFGGVSTYANNPQYRAWGGLKSLSYGNQTQMSMTFNNRLQANHFELKKTGQTTEIMKKNYDYYADGSLRYVEDELNPIFDRLMIYDHAGRIKEGKTGLEARGGTVSDQQQQTTQLPYRQSYQFNAFNNLTQRNNRHWGVEWWNYQSNNLSYTYQNNRVTNAYWEYDADGRVTYSFDGGWVSSAYDAKGQLTAFERSEEKQVERFYTGDGREAKRKEKGWVVQNGSGSWVEQPSKYYIRSSVFGGEVVSEADSTGRKRKTFVRGGGATLAWQTVYHAVSPPEGYVHFEHFDASAMSYRSTKTDGTAMQWEGLEGSPAELDPMGGNAGMVTPYVEPEPPPEPDYPTLQPLNAEMPMMVNGQRVSVTLDGLNVNFLFTFSDLIAMARMNALAINVSIPGESGTFPLPVREMLGTLQIPTHIAVEFEPKGKVYITGNSWFAPSQQQQTSRKLTREEIDAIRLTLNTGLKTPKGEFCRKFLNETLRDLGSRFKDITDVFELYAKKGAIYTGVWSARAQYPANSPKARLELILGNPMDLFLQVLHELLHGSGTTKANQKGESFSHFEVGLQLFKVGVKTGLIEERDLDTGDPEKLNSQNEDVRDRELYRLDGVYFHIFEDVLKRACRKPGENKHDRGYPWKRNQ